MRKLDPRVCAFCRATFQPKLRKIMFCSHACYAESRRGTHGPGNFERGIVPTNKAPVGTVRIRTRHGRGGQQRAYVKVAEPNVWRLRAHVIWEAANGPLPAGVDVHHINRDKLDDRIENLELLSRAEHLADHRAEQQARRTAGIRAAWAERRAHRAPAENSRT